MRRYVISSIMVIFLTLLMLSIPNSCSSPKVEPPTTLITPQIKDTPIQPITPPNIENLPSLPTLAAGYEAISDDFIDLDFAVPEGWTNEEMTDLGVLSTIYYLPFPGAGSIFRVFQITVLDNISSPDDVFLVVKPYLTIQGVNHLNTINEYEINISGQPAIVKEYYLKETLPSTTNEPFGIFAGVISPDHLAYGLQWSTTSENESDMREIFETMISSFQFVTRQATTNQPSLN